MGLNTHLTCPQLEGALNMQPQGLPYPADSSWGETWLEVNTCTCRKRPAGQLSLSLGWGSCGEVGVHRHRYHASPQKPLLPSPPSQALMPPS